MVQSVARSDSAGRDLTSMGTVVVVEDPLVSNLVRAVLQRHGYQVKLAQPQEAAGLLAAPDSGVRVLVTNSPRTFLEFADRVPLLYLSSAPDILLRAAFSSCQVVLKPFAPDDLVRGVAALTRAL